jgi:hypothetical protein
MAYYDICHICGATLDPGEKCDCAKQAQAAADRLKKLLTVDKNGQLKMA